MNELANRIVSQIRSTGAISFQKFMDLALYCPVSGYYEKEEDRIGAKGDFYTNVSLGPLFGEMLAWQFAAWLKSMTAAASKPDTRLRLVEAGAHRGKLAEDILAWFGRHEPELFANLDYLIIEPSERLQRWQQERLAGFNNKVSWTKSLSSASGAIRGIIFSNELLDAMPVHRLGWDRGAQSWFEWGVDYLDERFSWVRMPQPPEDRALPKGIPADLLAALPDGFTTETCPAAVEWWNAAANSLACGVLLTFDYGLDALDFFTPGRHEGTLRSYRGHMVSGDVLSEPGEKDITAQVNLELIRLTGEKAGLKTLYDLPQTQVLTRIAANIWRGGTSFDPWTSAHTRQFQTLTHPDHLGRAFRVLAQTRNL